LLQQSAFFDPHITARFGGFPARAHRRSMPGPDWTHGDLI
jgi:hypothetical protein